MEDITNEKNKTTTALKYIVGTIISLALLFGLLYITQLYNYLLFHTTVEIMGIIPSVMIFIIVLYVWKYINKNSFISYIGLSFLFIGIIDFIHSLAYGGMPIFYEINTDIPIQLWISARYLQAFSILIGSSLITSNLKVNRHIIIPVYTLIVSVILYSIFVLKIFPSCFVEGSGLTSFKIYSEYIICIILLISAVIIWRNKTYFEEKILYLLMFSILFQIISELSFTSYIALYGFSNFLGHYFKVIWILLFFIATLSTALGSPSALLILKMKKLVTQIETLNADLEIQVEDRTKELSTTIVDLKETQAQLIEAEKLASLGNLVTGLAHEINTPLGVIVTTITYLQNETDDILNKFADDHLKKSQLEKFLFIARDCENLIYSNISKTNDLVSDFKLVSPEVHVENIAEIELCSYLKDILASDFLNHKDHKIKVNLICNGEVKIQTIPLLLYQLIINILSNSKIHAYENGTGLVDIRVSRRTQYVEIEIEDYGKGIIKENLSKIFEPFFTTNRGGDGSGLGLYIIYNIINQNLKGNIVCESNLGKGTKFTITIPILLE